MARDNISKDGLLAILNKQKKMGVLEIVDANGDVKGTSCSLTEYGKDILESIKDVFYQPSSKSHVLKTTNGE